MTASFAHGVLRISSNLYGSEVTGDETSLLPNIPVFELSGFGSDTEVDFIPLFPPPTPPPPMELLLLFDGFSDSLIAAFTAAAKVSSVA